MRLQVELEQVVVMPDLPAGEGQGVAGALGQLELALAISQVQIQPIQRRIGQLQQPGLRPVRPLRPIFQIQAQPEYRTRITGIQDRVVMPAKARLQGGRGDFVDSRIATHILEHLHGLAKRQHAGMLIEDHGRGAQRPDCEQQNQEVAHAAPRRQSRVMSDCAGEALIS
ncbi:hypothetical protein D3C86_1620100 [compost metagenome]